MQPARDMPTQPSRHLLKIEDMNDVTIEHFLKRGEYFVQRFKRGEKKEPNLHGRTIINAFYEASTRTRVSFEIAAKRLGADIVNFSTQMASSSKGESLRDTAITLNAMRPDAIVVRSNESEATKIFADNVDCAVINAGNGSDEHPTQALLDALTIRQTKGRIEGLTVAICGDILHSRVCHSNIHLLTRMGAKIHAIGPQTLLPEKSQFPDVAFFETMQEGLRGADIVMMLRIQRERMKEAFMLTEEDYFKSYGLDEEKLSFAKPDAHVMDPGPVIRGVHIASSVADGPRSLIAKQVENGVAIRAAVLETLILRQPGKS
ncbi:MAG: aspartate carbamoyltransferase catalytic subunit [Pseudomonadota bacterium]